MKPRLTKQRSKTRYSKERSSNHKLKVLFSQFLDSRRSTAAAAMFYAMCKLENEHGDRLFTVKEVIERLRKIAADNPEILVEMPAIMTVRRIFYDFERIGLITGGATKRYNERYYSLTVNECKSGLVRQGKSLWAIYKKIHGDKNDD
jgi:hypothetical protein